MIADPAAGTTRVASYNIRKAIGTDRRRDPNRIMRVIRELRADVVVLQEADKRLGERPTALPLGALRDLTGMIPVETPNNVSIGWHGNAILVCPETEIGIIDHLHLPGIEPRGALVASIVVKSKPMRIIASHLGLFRPSRKEQLTAMFDHLALRDPCPTLIAGDMNEWSNKVGLGRLAKRFTIHAPGKTYHARLPVASLDRIAIDDRLEVIQAGVLENELTRKASDHLPVWVDIAHR